MALAYGARGLVGLLTPQANTTVEPEMAAMTPPGVAVVNARLKSTRGTIDERLVEYFDSYPAAVSEFANAPLSAVGFACTGASYLAGIEAEDRLVETLSAERGAPVATAATAVCDALRALGARRIALVSPYHQSLDEASAGYWAARGFEVATRWSAYRASDAFHPIYSLAGEAARPGIDAVANAEADAIVLLGTGMPTLIPIGATPVVNGKPLLSCMLCLGWRLLAMAKGEVADGESLTDFLHDPWWRTRLLAMRA